MKSIVFVGALMCLVAVAMAVQTVTFNGEKIGVTLNAKGAVATVTEPGSSKSFGLKFTQIQEVGTDGGIVNAVNSFSDLVFNDPTTPQTQTFQNINATLLSLSGNVNVASSGNSNSTSTASIEVTFYVFQGSGKITYGTTSYPVGPGSIEIIYTISGWPVVSTSNKLNLRVRVTTPGKTGTFTSPELRLFDGAAIFFASQSSNSNGQGPVTVTTSNGAGTVDITMQFQAANSIEYDPLWTVEAESSSASVLSPLFSSLLL